MEGDGQRRAGNTGAPPAPPMPLCHDRRDAREQEDSDVVKITFIGAVFDATNVTIWTTYVPEEPSASARRRNSA